MNPNVPASDREEGPLKIPIREASTDSPPDRQKICRPARGSGIRPSRRFGIWFALAVAVLGFAVPSQAGLRTTFVDASPRTRENIQVRIGQQMTFKARLVSGNRVVPNARVWIVLDGINKAYGPFLTRRDGSFEWKPVITSQMLKAIPLPSGGRNVGWAAFSARTGDFMAAPLQGYIHGWGFRLMPSSIASIPTAPQSTPSGLSFEVLQAGTGVRPVASSTVRMHYHCYLPNGTVIDSSVLRGQPFTASLNQMIKGLSEGLLLMRVGSKYRFTVPAYLAYGQNGVPPAIGPNQTLMFDIELLEVIY
jgi:hypothetical protein